MLNFFYLAKSLLPQSWVKVNIYWIVFFFSTDEEPADFYLSDMFAQLSAVVAAKPSERINIMEGMVIVIFACLFVVFWLTVRPRGYETFFILHSTEHKLSTAHK